MSEETMRVLSRASISELKGVAHGNPQLVWESHLDDLVEKYSLQTVEVAVRYEKGHEFKPGGPRDRANDESNAGILRKALPALTPSQATDERIWATLALGDYKEYVLRRWAVSDTTKYPLDLKVFVANTRALVRDHSLARLWWRSYFAQQVSKHHSLDPLALMFEYEDIPSEISGRSILTDSTVLSAYIGQLQAGLQAISEDGDSPTVLSKTYIQGIGKQLNFLAGRFQLGGISAERLSSLMQIAHRRTMQSLNPDA